MNGFFNAVYFRQKVVQSFLSSMLKEIIASTRSKSTGFFRLILNVSFKRSYSVSFMRDSKFISAVFSGATDM